MHLLGEYPIIALCTVSHCTLPLSAPHPVSAPFSNDHPLPFATVYPSLLRAQHRECWCPWLLSVPCPGCESPTQSECTPPSGWDTGGTDKPARDSESKICSSSFVQLHRNDTQHPKTSKFASKFYFCVRSNKVSCQHVFMPARFFSTAAFRALDSCAL